MMMNLHTTLNPLSALLSIPAPQAAAPLVSAEPNPAQPSFAQLLQHKQSPAQPAPTPAKAAPEASSHADQAARPAGPETAAHAPPAAQARAAASAREPAHETAHGREPATHGSQSTHDTKASSEATHDATASPDRPKDAEHSTATDPALADWVAGLNLPVPTLPVVPPPATTLTPSTTPTEGVRGEVSDGVTSVLACGPTGAAQPATATANLSAATAATIAATVPTAAPAVTSAATTDTPQVTTEPPALVTLDLAAGSLSAEAATRAALALPGVDRERNADIPTAYRGAVREGAEQEPAAALALIDGHDGHASHMSSGGSGDFGDGSNRGGAAPTWTPIALPSTNPTTAASTSFTPVGLSGIEPKADIRAAATLAAAAPVRMNLAPPITSPEFPQVMGAQLAVLAKGGVERAELHLNPAEMGPVSVQIAIEGTQARIDFGADFAATRQIIETGLPELASALRDAGLTLTGGGVSQHSRSREDMADAQARGTPRGGPGGQASAETGEPVAPTRRMVRAGGVDMYA